VHGTPTKGLPLLKKPTAVSHPSREARSLFEAAVYEEKLDPEILDVIRFGMKSPLGGAFLDGEFCCAALQSDAKALPKDGISFPVCYVILLLNFHSSSFLHGGF
jgi:hypothetical protein